MPNTQRVAIPWRAKTLPGYLTKPQIHHDSLPLVVFLNGATTSKEETILWSDHFTHRGLAVLSLDWPGTGEASTGDPLSSECDDITDGIISYAEQDAELDPARVALLGISLGGVVALRAAALDRRIDAVVTVTAPYDARRWIGSVNPIVAHQLLSLAGTRESMDELVAEFSLADVAPRLRCPTLIFGAGRDLVVPPDESLHLSAAIGDLATLVWYPEGTHALYEELDDWTGVAAQWLSALFRAPHLTVANESTQVDEPSSSERYVSTEGASNRLIDEIL